MKPHPYIRKTIKWGGAALTVLLVVVWWGSGSIAACVVARPNLQVNINRGRVHVFRTSGRFFYPPSLFIKRLEAPHRIDWTGQWVVSGGQWHTQTPLWIPLVAAVLAVGAVWRIDAVAGRRERARRLNRCPKCDYNRVGIAGDAKCPECGALPVRP